MTANDSVFLLLGPETDEKETFIKNAIHRLEQEKKSKAEVYKYFAFEAPCVEIASLLQNGLLFADCKAVIVFGVENLKKADIETLADCIVRPMPDSLLFLCSDETRLAGSRIENLVKSQNRKIFWELLEHQKKGFVRNYFNKRSISIADGAVDFILEMVEKSTRDLKTICERLEIFFGKDSTIRLEDIENYLYHGREENVFTLFAGIVKRDFGLSLEILDKLLLSNDEDPIRILSGLLWQVHQGLQFLDLLARNHSFDEAFEKLGIKAKRQQKLYAEIRDGFSIEALGKIVGLIADYDTRLRIYHQNAHRILLEFFIYSVIGLSNKKIIRP